MSETELALAFLVGSLSWPVLEKVAWPYIKGQKFLHKKPGGNK